MTDLSSTIIAKSDQLNADDLIGHSITIKIIKVTGQEGEQPISIHYDGDNGKPWKPCKSMRRVLLAVWGKDGNAYAGRSLTLYRDPKVKFGGMEVGGIRISHMSHIDQPFTMALNASKANKKSFTVQPLAVPEAPKLEDYVADIDSAPTFEGLEFKFKAAYRLFPDEESRAKLTAAKDKRKAELTTSTAIQGDPNVQAQV